MGTLQCTHQIYSRWRMVDVIQLYPNLNLHYNSSLRLQYKRNKFVVYSSLKYTRTTKYYTGIALPSLVSSLCAIPGKKQSGEIMAKSGKDCKIVRSVIIT